MKDGKPETTEEFEAQQKAFSKDVHDVHEMTQEMKDLIQQFQAQARKQMEIVETVDSVLNGSKIQACRTRGGFVMIGFEKAEVRMDFFKWLKNGGNFNS